ncbi:MAG: SRPBCC family protein, partial [Verrucomicrobiota bacterium]
MPRFQIGKNTEIAVPIQTAYDHVRDFRKWPEWSPWLITDPECKVSYEEDGAGYRWEGHVCGAGEMQVTSESS